MKKAFLLMLIVVTCGFSTAAQGPSVPPTPPQKHQVVTAAQVNGVYRFYKERFLVCYDATALRLAIISYALPG